MTRALFTSAVLAFASSVTTADTITVCLDGSCDYTDIQEAINAASDGDVIEIAAGTYYPAATIDTLGRAVTLRGVPGKGKDDAPTTVIDGQDSIRVLICEGGEGAGTVFENLLITGGLAEGDFHDNRGGGMYNRNNSNPTLIDCTFEGNSAEDYGGGMYNYGSSPTLTNCVFQENSADDYGGGMYCYSSSPTLTDTTLCGNSPDQVYGSWTDNGGNCIRLVCQDTNGDRQPDCEGTGTDDYLSVPSEYATIELAIDAAAEGALIDIAAGTYVPAVTLDTLGKAITLRGAIDGDGNPTSIIDGLDSMRVLQCTSGEGANTVFENLLITGGYTSVDGGGMYNDESSPTLVNCTFNQNSAHLGFKSGDHDENVVPGASGGGMHNSGSSSPTLTNCTFTNNSADWGGGMDNSGSSPTLTNCTFENNSAYSGGGMYNSGGSPTLDGCTFTGNTAGYDGGGMYNDYNSPTLTDCTFEGNSAGWDGGGMYNEEDNPTLTGCMFTECCKIEPTNSFIDGGRNDFAGNPYVACDECRADVDCDEEVSAADLGLLLSAWNTTEAQYDIDGDGVVGGGDLGILLGTWGACP